MTRGAAARGKRQGDILAGKYLLEDCLGVGGMGEVYRATNVSLGRKVAIKLLSAEYVKNEDDQNRFLREARAAAAVRHPNVVDVLDVSRDDDGTPFIVQELLAGEDLERYLKTRGGRLDADEAMELMIPVADAVAAAHAQNVVHRDLKPANIFLSRDRNRIVPKVLDFGAALFPTIAERSAKEARMLIGTPHYMAPEQIVDKTAVDARSDVWALGVILYEMMVGETPFEAETANAVLAKVKTVDVPPLRSRAKDAPIELEQIIAQCTNRERPARYADASGVRDALEALRKKRKGTPHTANVATLDDVIAPAPRAKPASKPKVPSLDQLHAPRPMEPSSLDMAPKRNLLTLSSPDDLDLPLPTAGEMAGSASASLDIAPPPFKPEEEPIPRSQSSLPPVLFSASAIKSKPPSELPLPLPAPLPADLHDDPSGLTALPLEKARPMGPAAVRPSDYAKRIVAQSWSKGDTVRLGLAVALPALILFLLAGLVPPLSQPVRHAMLGDSPLASGVLAVVALIVAAGLFARAALRERTRLSWLAAALALLFGVAMIITTFSASETADPESLSTKSLATFIGPLAPFVLSLDWVTKARDFFLDPYSRPEARRSVAVSALFLFLTLSLSPFGAVRAPARPMHAIQAMLK